MQDTHRWVVLDGEAVVGRVVGISLSTAASDLVHRIRPEIGRARLLRWTEASRYERCAALRGWHVTPYMTGAAGVAGI